MLWEHQKKLAEQALPIQEKYKIVYLEMDVRTGKTLTSLEIAKLSLANRVLVLTPKDVIKDFQQAYIDGGYEFNITITNYEQLSKFAAMPNPESMFDLIICDEAHMLKAYPKPTIRAQMLKKIVGFNKLILLSGTSHPESYTDLFFQFWISRYNPFHLDNFYKWAKEYVDVKKKRVNQGQEINDYSHAKVEKIMAVLEPYFVRFTQQEAGFKHYNLFEEVISIPLNENLRVLAAILYKHQYYKFKDGTELVCDSAVKLQSAYHQIYSGTIKLGDEHRILVTDKAQYIKDNYQGKKIGIFYKFIGEKLAIEKVFGKQNLTMDSREFQERDDKVFYIQIKKGSRGITLSTADILIFYNIDFSYEQYVQATQRHKVRDREKVPLVHWIFTEGGIEHFVYKRVMAKKDYNVNTFLSSFKIKRDKFHVKEENGNGIGKLDTRQNTKMARAAS